MHREGDGSGLVRKMLELKLMHPNELEVTYHRIAFDGNYRHNNNKLKLYNPDSSI